MTLFHKGSTVTIEVLYNIVRFKSRYRLVLQLSYRPTRALELPSP